MYKHADHQCIASLIKKNTRFGVLITGLPMLEGYDYCKIQDQKMTSDCHFPRDQRSWGRFYERGFAAAPVSIVDVFLI